MLQVVVNSQLVGSVFSDSGTYCPTVPDQDALLLDAATYNDLLAGGDLTILVGASGADPDACAPDPSFVIISIGYVMR